MSAIDARLKLSPYKLKRWLRWAKWSRESRVEKNNPLTTVLGNIQLLLGRGLQPAAVSEARRIYQEAERARRIVKNLLYFARENKPDRSVVQFE